MTRERIKSLLVVLIKYGVSLGIVSWLIWDAVQNRTFDRLFEGEKHWGILLAAWVMTFFSLMITFFRWHMLVRALDMPFRLVDAIRLGFLGYLFNFVSLGIVGGDLVKAIVLARTQPKRGAEATASVIVDRAMGLYALFLFASIFIIAFDQWRSPNTNVEFVCRAALIITAAGTLAVALLASPGPVRRWLSSPKHGGHMVHRLIGALGMYRRKPRVLIEGMLYSLAVHSTFMLTLFLISQGLPGDAPKFVDQLVIVPLSAVTGVIPLPANGLGALEGAIEYLYQAVPGPGTISPGQGLLVALFYRAITLSIAMVGVVYYLSNRQQLSDALQHAEADEAEAEAALEHLSESNDARAVSTAAAS